VISHYPGFVFTKASYKHQTRLEGANDRESAPTAEV